jgi:hypothetical protein
MGGQKVEVTQAMLADIKETFDGKCPVTLGHQLADWMPKFGNVSKLEPETSDSSIVSDLEIHDLLADALDEKFYDDLSVGIEKNLQGKHYLHHCAFLGAVPPKIRDLKVFSDIEVVYLGDSFPESDISPEDRAKAAGRIATAKQGASFGIEEAQRSISQLSAWATEMALTGDIPDELKDKAKLLADQLIKPKVAPKEEDVELKEENDQLKAELADRDTRSLSQAKESLKTLMNGKIPKAKQHLVLALAHQLGVGKPIELSDGDGKTEKISSLDILSRIISSIPAPVSEGRADLGDGEQPTDKKPASVDFAKA